MNSLISGPVIRLRYPLVLAACVGVLIGCYGSLANSDGIQQAARLAIAKL